MDVRRNGERAEEICMSRRPVTVTTTNASTLLSTLVEAALADYCRPAEVTAFTVSCEGNDARIGIGGSAATGLILYVGQSARWEANADFVGAYVVSKTADLAATLRIILEY